MLVCAIPGIAALAAAACTSTGDAAPRPPEGPHARFIKTITGFYGPESVKYDADTDAWFVSNMLGAGSSKDGAGYIVRIPAATLGPPEMFAESGRGGVTLDAPKGMTIHGDTLWVADIDVLRGFDKRTGRPLGTIDFRPQRAVLLNDVTVGHDGQLYVTDSGFRMTSKGVLPAGGERVFTVGPNHAISVVAAGGALASPNGIAPDPRGKGLVVVSFDRFRSPVYTFEPGSTPGPRLTIVGMGKGRFDGVEPLADGTFLVAAWNDSSIHVIGKGTDRKIIGGLSQPADIGVDTRRQRIAIPQVIADRVDFWELPR